jgi:hypothetical protein
MYGTNKRDRFYVLLLSLFTLNPCRDNDKISYSRASLYKIRQILALFRRFVLGSSRAHQCVSPRRNIGRDILRKFFACTHMLARTTIGTVGSMGTVVGVQLAGLPMIGMNKASHFFASTTTFSLAKIARFCGAIHV